MVHWSRCDWTDCVTRAASVIVCSIIESWCLKRAAHPSSLSLAVDTTLSMTANTCFLSPTSAAAENKSHWWDILTKIKTIDWRLVHIWESFQNSYDDLACLTERLAEIIMSENFNKTTGTVCNYFHCPLLKLYIIYCPIIVQHFKCLYATQLAKMSGKGLVICCTSFLICR